MRRGQILGAAFALYRKSFAAFAGMAALVTIPLSLGQAYVAERFLRPLAITPGDEVGEIVIDERFWKAVAGLIVAGLVATLAIQLLTGALTRAAVLAVAEERPNVGASFLFALRRIHSILWISFITALFVFAGSLALIVPGVIVLVRTLLAMPAFVLEGLRGSKALKRSWNLVKGDGWMVFGMYLLTAIFSGIVGGLLTAPFREGWIVPGLASGVAFALTIPYTTAVIVYLYLDLRARKEGLDREGLVLELAGGRALPPPPVAYGPPSPYGPPAGALPGALPPPPSLPPPPGSPPPPPG
jgi:hypothetical protein